MEDIKFAFVAIREMPTNQVAGKLHTDAKSLKPPLPTNKDKAVEMHGMFILFYICLQPTYNAQLS